MTLCKTIVSTCSWSSFTHSLQLSALFTPKHSPHSVIIKMNKLSSFWVELVFPTCAWFWILSIGTRFLKAKLDFLAIHRYVQWCTNGIYVIVKDAFINMRYSTESTWMRQDFLFILVSCDIQIDMLAIWLHKKIYFFICPIHWMKFYQQYYHITFKPDA